MRLIKVAKLLKWIIRNEKTSHAEDDLSPDEDIDIKMSVVGRKMTERITKKGNITFDDMNLQQ